MVEDFRKIDDLVFVTAATTVREMLAVELLIGSIRSFGGALSDVPLLLFTEYGTAWPSLKGIDEGIRTLPLTVPDSIRGYELAEKVCACAEAERRVPAGTRAIVWLSPDTLIVNPPVRFALSDDCDAALRPVHIRNVGIPIDEHLDGFWRGVMDCAGIDDTDYPVQSFVDRQKIRAYFNSHSYCIRPSIRLFRKWLDGFEKLVCDKTYQTRFCSDELHRIFLHQAVLSALTVATIKPERIEILPETYSYPYNLQKSVPTASRATEMNQLVSVVYESHSLDPDRIEGLEIKEPLKSWLAERVEFQMGSND